MSARRIPQWKLPASCSPLEPASLRRLNDILFCTLKALYHILPTTACAIQDALGVPKSAGAIDYNLGCSGFVVGLGLAKGLIETGQACEGSLAHG